MTLIVHCLFMCVSDMLPWHLMASGNLSGYLHSILLSMTWLFLHFSPLLQIALSWSCYEKVLDFSPSLLNSRGQQLYSICSPTLETPVCAELQIPVTVLLYLTNPNSHDVVFIWLRHVAMDRNCLLMLNLFSSLSRLLK